MDKPRDVAALTPPAPPFSPLSSTVQSTPGSGLELDVDPSRASHRTRSFSTALAVLEGHRKAVQIALAVALLARIVFEFRFLTLLGNSRNLMVEVPYLGIALLSYLIVLWFLAARTRDRFGFGMALGIGVIEATYLLVMLGMLRPFSVAAAWPMAVVAAAHIPVAVTAFRSSVAFPPHDSKQPWIVGFCAALVFLAIPWLVPISMLR